MRHLYVSEQRKERHRGGRPGSLNDLTECTYQRVRTVLSQSKMVEVFLGLLGR